MPLPGETTYMRCSCCGYLRIEGYFHPVKGWIFPDKCPRCREIWFR